MIQGGYVILALASAVIGAMVAIGLLHANSLLRDSAAARSEIERRATHDALTDLPNRALFADRLEQELRLADRNGTTVTLHMMDLDRFKTVNDAFGHAVGDAFLVSVARRFEGALRQSDTLARLGGDEFAVVQPTEDGTAPLAERLRRALDAPVDAAGRMIPAWVSIGTAVYPEDGYDSETLCAAADAELYEDKRRKTCAPQ